MNREEVNTKILNIFDEWLILEVKTEIFYKKLDKNTKKFIDEKLKIAWLNGAFVEKNNEIYNDFKVEKHGCNILDRDYGHNFYCGKFERKDK